MYVCMYVCSRLIEEIFLYFRLHVDRMIIVLLLLLFIITISSSEVRWKDWTISPQMHVTSTPPK